MAQLSVTATGSDFTIDFDNTVPGVNNDQFTGSGFQSTPSTGELDADAWQVDGLSDDGDMDFGDTKTSGDFARGSNNGGVGTGGVYAFEVATNDFALGIQPGGSDWTPGTFTLRIQNSTGVTVTSLDVDYDIYVYNDQSRGNSFNFAHSDDDMAYTSESSLNYTSPASSSGGSWVSVARSITLTGLNIPDGSFYYLQWQGDDVSGSGSRDEFALDNIVINASGSGGSGPELQLNSTDACGSFGLNYGNVAPSTTSDLTFDINNTGTADLDVTSLSISGADAGDFSIVSPATPFTVSASGTQTVTVEYTAPATPGTSNATLTINNNDGDEGSCVVDLSGTSSTAISIPDDGCGSMMYATSTINYSGGTSIADVNVFVSITHEYRSDLVIELESPEGTVIQLLDGATGGAAENLEVIFDDDAVASISTSNHTVNGIADQTVVSAGSGTLGAFQNENPNGTWTLRVCDDAGADLGDLESWSLDITENCTPVHSVSTVSPADAPVGAVVTLGGSGFTGSTTVTVDGMPVTLSSQNATSLTFVLPSSTTGGQIVVTESGCDVNTAVGVLDTENCSSAPANWSGDLLISGVYDETSGSCHYIELFNPTSSPINLSTYSLGSDNNASSATAPAPGSYNGGVKALSGTVQPNSTFMVRASSQGSSCNSCGNITPDLEFTNFGFNGDGIDRVFLIKAGTEIDLWANGQGYNDGFIATRNNGATAPTLSYSNGDWSGNNSPSCFGFTVSVSTPPSVSAISDATTCASLAYGVTATAGQGGSLTYEWYYDNGAGNWTQVTAGNPAGYNISGQSTAALTIAPGASTLADLESGNYQFHVKVIESGTCARFSSAIQFVEVAVDPYFRSRQSGDWQVASNWEMSPDGSSGWTTACEYPVATNSDEVTILSGHTMTVMDDGDGAINISIDDLTIDAGGTFEIEATAEVELANGSGVDMTVNGTLLDRGGSSGGFTSFLGTWVLGAGATIRKTGNSSVANYRDGYQGGIASIPEDGNWIFEYDGSNNIAVVAVDMFYPNLTFISSSGNYQMDAANKTFTGGNGPTGGYATVKGDFNIGTSGGGTVQLRYNNMFSGSPMLILGDLNIGAGSSLTNATFNAADPCTNARGDGTGFEVRGDLTIDGSLTVVTYTSSDADCATHERMLRFGQSSPGTTQIVSGSGTITAYKVEMQNADGIILDGINLNILNELEFMAGIISANANEEVIVTNSNMAAVSGGGSSTYVDGRLRWNMATATTYTFPVGEIVSNCGYAPFDIAFSGAVPGNIVAFFDDSTPTAMTPPGQVNCDVPDMMSNLYIYDYNCVAGGWDIQPNTGTAYDYTLTLTDCAVCGGNYYKVVKDGSYTNGCPDGAGSPIGAMFTDFSTFNLLSADMRILPVSLLDFTAERDGSAALLRWRTTAESGNRHFVVERSADGRTYAPLGQVPGAGDTDQPQAYRFVDDRPLPGLNYYRLRQVDYSGAHAFFGPKALRFEEASADTPVRLWPVPATDQLWVELTGQADTSWDLEIWDVNGRLLLERSLPEARLTTPLPTTALPAGAYLLRWRNGTRTGQERFVKR